MLWITVCSYSKFLALLHSSSPAGARSADSVISCHADDFSHSQVARTATESSRTVADGVDKSECW